MTNKLSIITWLTALCVFLSALPSCTSDNNGDQPQNTLTVNGAQYTTNHSGYWVGSNHITLYFGNSQYNNNPTQSLKITVNSQTLSEASYTFIADAETGNQILSVTYNGSEKEIKSGDIILIQLDSGFIVNYQLNVNGYTITGHYTGSIPLLQAQ